MGLHPSHKTRVSLGASSFDEICDLCGATDEIGSWGALAKPCPAIKVDTKDSEISVSDAKNVATKSSEEFVFGIDEDGQHHAVRKKDIVRVTVARGGRSIGLVLRNGEHLWFSTPSSTSPMNTITEYCKMLAE